ncbi:hypothetical protein C0Q70_10174 [Pomacea canaliculata]|uniref:Uncharacterized protein n=1 Tax=Pomacea canaliculata TaxID=400727 RepID=A0A2T7PBW2_POMCA|nr:hypothetical protein C0Q70_10174 [Pomacea canaliculata]
MLEAGIGQKLIYGTNELLPFGSQCQMASGLFQGCPPAKKSSAIRSCNEILRNARLVTCLGPHLMEAFNTCLDQVCQGNLCSYTFPELKCGDLPDDLVHERKLYCP